MAEKIVVGPINKGQRTDREPFIIDNDSFPNLVNAYQWRGRIKRKRGTELLGRLNRFFSSGSTTITLVGGSGNLLTGFSIPQAGATLVPGTISITDIVTGFIYTDPNADGNLYNVVATITGATQANPCVLTAANNFPAVGKVFISGVQGMTQLNGNTYTIISRTSSTITISVDSTGFTPYTMGGIASYSNTANIMNATQAVNCVLTASNNFPATGSVFITGVNGMTELNGNTYAIVADNPASVTLSVNSTSFHAYIAGGIASYFALAGTINYSTGAFTITGAGADTVTAIFNYYPDLPVMGVRNFQIQPDFNVDPILNLQPPIAIAFDTVYSYEIAPTLGADAEYLIYDISFFKNPSTPVAKGIWTPITWSGADFQQFWTTNFAGAMWATNGKPGMQFQLMTAIVINSPTQLTITVPPNSNLKVGDWIFVNETGNATVDQQTGYVNAITVPGATTFTAIFPNANMSGAVTPGMVQYLTNLSPPNPGDGIRWYDGDPTAGGNYPPTQPVGWVNYAPPLSQGSFSINGTPNGQYYLVGATMIYPFRDFLLFIGPWIQGSGRTGSTPATPIALQDTVIFCANGTPYYTASFDNSTFPYSSLKTYNALLVPTNQSAYPMVAWEDVTGFGGYIASGVAQPITTLVPNEDVLIMGYPKAFTRLIYTGNNLIPFLFYRINTELGANSTFSAITFDKGSFTTGNFGICLTTQVASQRIDLEIPDQVFKINFANNGYQRVCAGRDFINEWVYITYPSNSVMWKFPNQTLMYNYRDESWAIHNECYTSYGLFYPETGDTWATKRLMWEEDNDTWNASVPTVGNAELVGGNQQGFLLLRKNETEEGSSLFIANINTSTGVVTSPNHCLNFNDPYSNARNFVIFEDVIGPVTSGGVDINGRIFRVDVIDVDTFTVFPLIDGGTYSGGGTMKRAYVPFIQTKQFPLSWGTARKTILGPQMYLLTRTPNGQITLNIYLSTDPATIYNDPATNDAMVYTQVLYTCPESTNLGLTPANTNLQQINQFSTGGSSSNNQAQIWHRMNTSLIGDTVQVGFTISETQMLDPSFNNQFVELELHAMTLDVSPGGYLA